MTHRSLPSTVDEHDIAIIGMACRVPGARSLAGFWRNLRDGVESISFFSREELLAAGHDPAVVDHPDYVPANGVVTDPEMFDAAFFGYNPNEAALLDPQQRIFLESAVEALERAGYGAEDYRGVVGVYAGAAGWNTYLLNHLMQNQAVVASNSVVQLMVGSAQDFLPTRVSYKLNLHGPSVNVQTACSTSLVAVHLACQGILGGECSMALAGGVSLGLPQVMGYFGQAGMFSSDGHCRAFDAAASGLVKGNGLAIVVLKRLADALEDGDTVHAVIKGSAINNDGSEKVGFTAPSIDGQAAVIGEALAIADVDPETITYVETHGTGTELGDPIEFAGLTQAFRAQGSEGRGTCAIGSLKPNVGHLDSAAGAASLIKTALALQHKTIPPSLHFETPNPEIDVVESPFYVNAEKRPWPQGTTPRRAGVSSFGLGGTNAHVVLEEAPLPLEEAPLPLEEAPLPLEEAPSPLEEAPLSLENGESRRRSLLVLSAKTSTALETATANLRDHLEDHRDSTLADVAYTLQVGRQPFEHRRMLVCESLEEAVAELAPENASRLATARASEELQGVVFMFPGAGAQYVTMGQDLYDTEAVFREQVDRCATWLTPRLGVDLRSLLYHPADPQQAAEKFRQPLLALPALFVTEYALARLWMSLGFKPRAMIGLSLGEYVAACLAGVFSLEDALALVHRRAQLINTLPPGGMLAIAAGEEEVQRLLDAEKVAKKVSIALINTQASCVVAGPAATVDVLQARLEKGSLEFRRLPIAGAGHCALMDPIVEPFRQFVATLSLKPPQVPYISNLTGTWITPAEAMDADYWARHLRHTVRFAEGLQTVLAEPEQILLEVGPGRTLATLARGHAARKGQPVLTSMRHPKEETSDAAFLLATLGRLWLVGATVDWNALYGEERRRRVPLPTYPFERRKYWIEPQPAAASNHRLGKRPDLADWFYLPVWKQSKPASLFPQKSWPEEPQSWLLFVDESTWVGGLSTALAAARQEVFTVRRGDAFARTGTHDFVLRPGAAEDYLQLIAELMELDKRPVEIVHAWTVAPVEKGGQGSAFERTARAQAQGFDSLVCLAQALETHGWTEPLSLTVLSNNLQAVLGEDGLCPEKALVLGPVKVIPLEYPHITCRSVDVAWPTQEKPEQRLVEQVLEELRCAAPEALVAYRGAHRYTQEFEPVRLENAAPKRRLREQAVVLITGGLGGVGMAVAQHLAEKVQARLVLVGRTPFPDREDWEQWLAEHGEDEATCEKICQLQRLEKLGAEVLVLSADVADQEEMRGVVQQARARFGDLHGVVHAAVVLDSGVMCNKSPQTMAQSLAAKVQGTLVLDAVLADQPLDFMAYFASLTGIFGAFGNVEYVAANLFQDAYAHQRTAASGQWTVSIDWDRWLHTGGSTVEFEEMVEKLTGEAVVGMTAEEGAEAFRRIIEHPVPPHVLVSVQDFDAVLSQALIKLGAQDEVEIAAEEVHGRPALTTPYVAPETSTQQSLVNIYQKLLGIEPVGIEDDFFELGGHSLLGTRVVSLVREALQLEVPLRGLFDHPTVAEFATHLDELLLARQMQQEAAEVATENRNIGRL